MRNPNGEVSFTRSTQTAYRKSSPTKTGRSRTVFIVGHPASGKTILYTKIAGRMEARGMTCLRVSDREVLIRLVAQDTENLFHTRTATGATQITSSEFYVKLFRELGQSIAKAKGKADWIFVELTSSDYVKTIPLFDPDLLSQSDVVVVLVDLDTALERNSQRPINTEFADEYRVPPDYINDCFEQDYDLRELIPLFRRGIVVENTGAALSLLGEAAERVFHWLATENQDV
jgi:molybdopterin-guanine dinucleotide biosynthesis protein